MMASSAVTSSSFVPRLFDVAAATKSEGHYNFKEALFMYGWKIWWLCVELKPLSCHLPWHTVPTPLLHLFWLIIETLDKTTLFILTQQSIACWFRAHLSALLLWWHMVLGVRVHLVPHQCMGVYINQMSNVAAIGFSRNAYGWQGLVWSRVVLATHSDHFLQLTYQDMPLRCMLLGQVPNMCCIHISKQHELD